MPECRNASSPNYYSYTHSIATSVLWFRNSGWVAKNKTPSWGCSFRCSSVYANTITWWVHAIHQLKTRWLRPRLCQLYREPCGFSSCSAAETLNVNAACVSIWHFIKPSDAIVFVLLVWGWERMRERESERGHILLACACDVRVRTQSRKILADAIIKFILRIIKYISHPPPFFRLVFPALVWRANVREMEREKGEIRGRDR